MDDPQIFKRRDAEDEAYDTRRARLQYDTDTVEVSKKRWSEYTPAEQDVIFAEGNRIYGDLARALTAGKPATDPDVQAIFERWADHLHYFYEPTLDMLAGLGEMYATDPEFRATFEAVHVDLPGYLQEGIREYVDTLETRQLQEMLDEDEARNHRLSS
jgi:hypothetical protein